MAAEPPASWAAAGQAVPVARPRIFGTSFVSVYPLDVTGYDDAGLARAIADRVDLETWRRSSHRRRR